MVNITPVTLWHEGASKTVSKLDVASSYDDLKSYATFVYRLVQEIENPQPPAGQPAAVPMDYVLISGTSYMGGQDYIDWDNSNEAAYEYVAGKLNLTIVPDPAP